MKKRKTARRRRRKTRKVGGAIDCEKMGFTQYIREATLGNEYNNSIADHDIGEQTPYNELVDISTNGLVGWYCKQAKLAREECKRITSMEEVQELGAFFHRYKVFLEHFGAAVEILKTPGLFDSDGRIAKSVMQYIKKWPDKQSVVSEPWEFIKKHCIGGSEFGNFSASDANLQITIDRVQCLLWVIVQNKGLPDGFVMDKGIRERARTPIKLLDIPYQFTTISSILKSNQSPIHAVIQLGNLIKIIIIDAIELNPAPTFGVYE